MKTNENDNNSNVSHNLTIHNSTINLSKSNMHSTKHIDLINNIHIQSNLTFNNNNNQSNHISKKSKEFKTAGRGGGRGTSGNPNETKMKNFFEKEEIEFPNIRTFSKELMQNIYKKESGEILSILRKSNDAIKYTKNPIQHEIIINKNQEQDKDSESNDKFLLSKMENYMKVKILEEENLSGKSGIIYNNNNNSNENETGSFQPGMMSFKVKKKNTSNNNNNNSNKISSVIDINNNNTNENLNRHLPLTLKSTNNIPSNNKIGNKDDMMRDIITRNSSSNNFNANMEDKSLLLTQSSKGGFPKILGKLNHRKSDSNYKIINNNNEETNLLMTKKKS